MSRAGFVPLVALPLAVAAQSVETEPERRLLGATAGGFAVGSLALAGSLPACNRVLDPTRCARWAAIGGTAVGIGSGIVIGERDPEQIDERLEDAAIGGLIGAGVGIALRSLVRQYGWVDAAAISLLGFAVGASAEGAGIGAATGAATGLALWWLHPRVGPAGAVALSSAGLGIGAALDWISGAFEDQRSGVTALELTWIFRW